MITSAHFWRNCLTVNSPSVLLYLVVQPLVVPTLRTLFSYVALDKSFDPFQISWPTFAQRGWSPFKTCEETCHHLPVMAHMMNQHHRLICLLRHWETRHIRWELNICLLLYNQITVYGRFMDLIHIFCNLHTHLNLWWMGLGTILIKP